MRWLGCAYYPEYWGPERLATDARLMRECGMNLVRMGEFAWSRLEPSDGRFDFGWLEEAVQALAREGLAVMLCTPTATPPAWLTTDHPDTLLTYPDGRKVLHGNRRHYCPTSRVFREYSRRITDRLTRAFAGNRAVVAWQLDNELGPEHCMCHCEACHEAFRLWLRARYGTLEALNKRWRTAFWSMDYSDWTQIRLTTEGNHAPSRILDSKRFWSESSMDVGLEQARIVRANHPGAVVTTNGMGPIFRWLDYYRLFGEMDVASDDMYFDLATLDANVAAMNVYRSLRPGRPFWVTETGAGALDHNRPPRPGQLRAWAWSALAHGAEAWIIFRWRTCLSGGEQELQGILEHSGAPRHRYRAVQTMFRELGARWPELSALPLPRAQVAVVQDYETLWTYQASRVGGDVRYLERIYDLHKDLWRRNVVVDIVPPDRPLLPWGAGGYRLVILPSTVRIPPVLARALDAYVRAGGTVLAIGQVGMRDDNASYHDHAGPEGLQDLLGVEIQGGMYLGSRIEPDEAIWFPEAKGSTFTVALEGTLGGTRLGGRAEGWIADLTLRGGTAALTFTEDTYAGQPAVVTRATGAGTAVTVGALWGRDGVYAGVLDRVLSMAAVEAGPGTPANVEAVRRGDTWFVVNHTAQPVRVPLPGAYRALVGEMRGVEAVLEPYGVVVAGPQ